jgi:hypothetical protein
MHGSFSFMVNFHALRVAVAAAHGACAMTSPYADGFKSAAYFFAPSAGAAAPPVPTGADLDAAIAAAMADESDCSTDADAAEPSHWRRPFPHARWAFRDGLQAFTAEDFEQLFADAAQLPLFADRVHEIRAVARREADAWRALGPRR